MLLAARPGSLLTIAIHAFYSAGHQCGRVSVGSKGWQHIHKRHTAGHKLRPAHGRIAECAAPAVRCEQEGAAEPTCVMLLHSRRARATLHTCAVVHATAGRQADTQHAGQALGAKQCSPSPPRLMKLWLRE